MEEKSRKIKAFLSKNNITFEEKENKMDIFLNPLKHYLQREQIAFKEKEMKISITLKKEEKSKINAFLTENKIDFEEKEMKITITLKKEEKLKIYEFLSKNNIDFEEKEMKIIINQEKKLKTLHFLVQMNKIKLESKISTLIDSIPHELKESDIRIGGHDTVLSKEEFLWIIKYDFLKTKINIYSSLKNVKNLDRESIKQLNNIEKKLDTVDIKDYENLYLEKLIKDTKYKSTQERKYKIDEFLKVASKSLKEENYNRIKNIIQFSIYKHLVF